MPNFTFCEGYKQAITKFILFMNFDMVQKSSLAFDKVSELDQMGILYQTESFLIACISLVHKAKTVNLLPTIRLAQSIFETQISLRR